MNRYLPIIITAAILLTSCSPEPELVIHRPMPSPIASVVHPSSAKASADKSVSSAFAKASADKSDSSVSSDSSDSSDSSTPPPSPLPSSVRITMPFASQAPHGNWDMPYQEACEEASLIIVHHYLEGTPLNADVMDSDILDMVAYEESMGLPADITMHELAQVAQKKYGYTTEVVEDDNVTIERIERELAAGNPVIMPLQGQDIGNPYFSGDGPPYHVLVILGYDSKNFITHDVGTRHGANYAYKKEVLISANHDWTGNKETMRSGPQRILIVRK